MLFHKPFAERQELLSTGKYSGTGRLFAAHAGCAKTGEVAVSAKQMVNHGKKAREPETLIVRKWVFPGLGL